MSKKRPRPWENRRAQQEDEVKPALVNVTAEEACLLVPDLCSDNVLSHVPSTGPSEYFPSMPPSPFPSTNTSEGASTSEILCELVPELCLANRTDEALINNTVIPSSIPSMNTANKPPISMLPSSNITEPTVPPSVQLSHSGAPSMQNLNGSLFSIYPSVTALPTSTLLPTLSSPPTSNSSEAPSLSPSASMIPTATWMPTHELNATLLQSIAPSLPPSGNSSQSPSIVPSIPPSLKPSVLPSNVPSTSPSLAPSAAKSFFPSFAALTSSPSRAGIFSHQCDGWEMSSVARVRVDFAYTFQTTSELFVYQQELDEHIINVAANELLACTSDAGRLLIEGGLTRIAYSDPPSILGGCPVSVIGALACWYVETTIFVFSAAQVSTRDVRSELLAVVSQVDIKEIVPNTVYFEIIAPELRNETQEDFGFHAVGIAGIVFSFLCLAAATFMYWRYSSKKQTRVELDPWSLGESVHSRLQPESGHSSGLARLATFLDLDVSRGGSTPGQSSRGRRPPEKFVDEIVDEKKPDRHDGGPGRPAKSESWTSNRPESSVSRPTENKSDAVPRASKGGVPAAYPESVEFLSEDDDNATSIHEAPFEEMILPHDIQSVSVDFTESASSDESSSDDSSEDDLTRDHLENNTQIGSTAESLELDEIDGEKRWRPTQAYSRAVSHRSLRSEKSARSTGSRGSHRQRRRRGGLPRTYSVSGSYGSSNNSFQSRFGTDSVGSKRRRRRQNLKTFSLRGFDSYESDGDDGHYVDFLKDTPREMTWGRRIALALKEKNWYNPLLKRQQSLALLSEEGEDFGIETRPPLVTRKEIPSLEKAWAYFEHNTLPRHLVDDYGTYDLNNLARAVPGDQEHLTKLYDPVSTPISSDFGVGYGLYFSTLRGVMILMFVAGVMNLQNFFYFSSDLYSDDQSTVSTLVRGSAICTRTKIVPCIGCDQESFHRDRFDLILDTATGLPLPFALKNDCNGATLQQGMVNYFTVILVVFGVLLIHKYQKLHAVQLHEERQTARDYSIRVKNPPADASDADEWREFFRKFKGSRATVVTVALDNDDLIDKLKRRRDYLRRIEINVKAGTSLEPHLLAQTIEDEAQNRGCLGKLLSIFIPGLPELYESMTETEERIREDAKKRFAVTDIFVTFETEKEQRYVLRKLSSVASEHKKQKDIPDKDTSYLFRNKHVIIAKEPEEPSTIRWTDLNLALLDRIKPVILTTLSTLSIVIAITFWIRLIHNWNTSVSATTIALLNGVFPSVAKFLTSFERHSTEGVVSTSFYFKIAFFRWVNSAIIITLITPFTLTLAESGGLVPSVYSIFFAEIFTTNAIKLADPIGHFKRHILAPRALSQDGMNSKMTGQDVDLAERYTNMTMLMFLAFWFSAIYPGAFFMCAAVLFVNFYADRFGLMRTWKPMPSVGTRVADFSRRYFFTTAVIAMAIVSSYYWSGFPYDDLCENDLPAPREYFGTHIVFGESIAVEAGDPSYRYCRQALAARDFFKFPALSRFQPPGDEWMTSEQEVVVDCFGWTSIVVVLAVAGVFVHFVYRLIRKSLESSYRAKGEQNDIPFAQVENITAYIPQVSSNVYPNPLLVCLGYDAEIIDWVDSDRPYSYYDLTEDLVDLTNDRNLLRADRNIFSIVSYSPAENHDGPAFQRRRSADLTSIFDDMISDGSGDESAGVKHKDGPDHQEVPKSDEATYSPEQENPAAGETSFHTRPSHRSGSDHISSHRSRQGDGAKRGSVSLRNRGRPDQSEGIGQVGRSSSYSSREELFSTHRSVEADSCENDRRGSSLFSESTTGPHEHPAGARRRSNEGAALQQDGRTVLSVTNGEFA